MIDGLKLKGTYLEVYNQIARPDFIFSCTRYFVERWLRVLGPRRAWLIVGLRQAAYWNQQQDWCEIDAVTLSRQIGCNRSRLFDWLDDSYVPWFVWRDGHSGYREEDGRPKRNPNKYKVLLDEPLTPADAEHLSHWLQEHTPSGPDAALAVLQIALKTPRMELLAPEHLLKKKYPAREKPRSVQAIIEEALPETAPGDQESRILLADLCSRLHSHLVEPQDQLLTSHYFRLNFVPSLPPGLAWIIFWLRDRCWYDPTNGRYRDTTWVPEVKTLADLVGASKRSVERWLDGASPEWIQVVEQKRGRDAKRPQRMGVRFQVAVRDILTEDDEKRFRSLFEEKDDKKQLTGQAEGRQKVTLVEAGSTTESDSRDRQRTTKSNAQTEQTATKYDSQEESSTTKSDGATGQRTTKSDGLELIIPSLTKKLKQQQQLHSETPVAAALSIDDWLTAYGINDPAYSRIIQLHSDPVYLVGWLLLVEAEEWVDDARALFVKSVLESRKLPFPFALFADMTLAQWLAFATRPDKVTSAERQLFELWLQVYRSTPIPWQLDELLEPVSEEEVQGNPFQETAAGTELSVFVTEIWSKVLADLEMRMTQATFDTWVRDTRVLEVNDEVWVIGCSSQAARDWLSGRLYSIIGETLSSFVEVPAAIQFVYLGPGAATELPTEKIHEIGSTATQQLLF